MLCRPERIARLTSMPTIPSLPPAILTAPQSLSDLSDAEWSLVKHKVEAKALTTEILRAEIRRRESRR